MIQFTLPDDEWLYQSSNATTFYNFVPKKKGLTFKSNCKQATVCNYFAKPTDSIGSNTTINSKQVIQSKIKKNKMSLKKIS